MKGFLRKGLSSDTSLSYIAVSYIMVVLIGIFDYITNPEFSFSLFYLIPISLNTWYSTRKHGYLIAIASAVCWWIVDVSSTLVYHNFIAPYWNSAIRLGFFTIVVFLLSEIKYLNRNLENIVVQRTSELTTQMQKKIEIEAELRKSKDLYQDLVENINEVYYTTDIHGYFKYVSPNFYKTTGHQESSVSGIPFYKLIEPADLDRIKGFYETTILQGKIDSVCEFRIKHSDGQGHWYEQTSRIIRNSENQPVEFHNLLRNITERKSAEIALANSEMKFKSLFSQFSSEQTEIDYTETLHQTPSAVIMKSLAERVDEVTNKMSSRVKQAIGFSSLASHELRTPLAIIRNQLEENLRSDVPLENIRETTASIYDEVLRLQRIIGDLLKISKMEAGKFVLHKEVVRLDEFIESFFSEVQLLTQENNIHVKLCNTEPVSCSIDKDYFLQMLFNIFDNALKFTPESGEIEINCDARGKDAVITIKDSGPGISSAALNNLFKDFYQTDQQGNSFSTGLGLILSRWIAELHNGNIEIESTVNVGTKVSISIPIMSD